MAVDAGFTQVVQAKVSLDTLAHPAYLATPIAEKLIAKTNVTGLSHIAALATMTTPIVEASVEFNTLTHQRVLGGFEQVVRVSVSEPEIQEALSGFNSIAITAADGFLPKKLTGSGLTITMTGSTVFNGTAAGSVLGSFLVAANLKTDVSGIARPTVLASLLEKVFVSNEVSTRSSPTVLGEFTTRLVTSVVINKVVDGTLTINCIPKIEFTTSVIKNSDFTATLITKHDLIGQVAGLQISSGFQETISVYSILGSKKLVQAEPILETLTVDALLQSELEPVIINAGFSTVATASVNLFVNKLVVNNFTLVSKLASTTSTAKQIQKDITSSISVTYEIEAGIFLGVVTVSCLRSSYTVATGMVNKTLCNMSLTSMNVPSIVLKTVCITEAAPQISTIVPEVILTSRTTVCQQNCY